MNKLLKSLMLGVCMIVLSVGVIPAFADTYTVTPTSSYLKSGRDFQDCIYNLHKTLYTANHKYDEQANVDGIYWVDDEDEFKTSVNNQYVDISSNGNPVYIGCRYVDDGSTYLNHYDYLVYTISTTVYFNANCNDMFGYKYYIRNDFHIIPFNSKYSYTTNISEFLTDDRVNTSLVKTMDNMFNGLRTDLLDLSKFDFSSLILDARTGSYANEIVLKFNNSDHYFILDGFYSGPQTNYDIKIWDEESIDKIYLNNYIGEMTDFEHYYRDDTSANDYDSFYHFSNSTVLDFYYAPPSVENTEETKINSKIMYYSDDAIINNIFYDRKMIPMTFILSDDNSFSNGLYYYRFINTNNNEIVRGSSINSSIDEETDTYLNSYIKDIVSDDNHLFIITTINIMDSSLKSGTEFNVALKDLLNTLGWTDAEIYVNVPPIQRIPSSNEEPDPNIGIRRQSPVGQLNQPPFYYLCSSEIQRKYEALYNRMIDKIVARTDFEEYPYWIDFTDHIITIAGYCDDYSFMFSGIQADVVCVGLKWNENIIVSSSDDNNNSMEVYQYNPSNDSKVQVKQMAVQATSEYTLSSDLNTAYMFANSRINEIFVAGSVTKTNNMFENTISNLTDLTEMSFLFNNGIDNDIDEKSFKLMTAQSGGSNIQPYIAINVEYTDMFKGSDITKIGIPTVSSSTHGINNGGIPRNYRSQSTNLFRIKDNTITCKSNSNVSSDAIILDLYNHYMRDISEIVLHGNEQIETFNTLDLDEFEDEYIIRANTISYNSYTVYPYIDEHGNEGEIEFLQKLPYFTVAQISDTTVKYAVSTWLGSNPSSELTKYYNGEGIKNYLKNTYPPNTDIYVIDDDDDLIPVDDLDSDDHVSVLHNGIYYVEAAISQPLHIEQYINLTDQIWENNEQDVIIDLTNGQIDPNAEYIEDPEFFEWFNSTHTLDTITTEEVEHGKVVLHLSHDRDSFIINELWLTVNESISSQKSINDSDMYLTIIGSNLVGSSELVEYAEDNDIEDPFELIGYIYNTNNDSSCDPYTDSIQFNNRYNTVLESHPDWDEDNDIELILGSMLQPGEFFVINEEFVEDKHLIIPVRSDTIFHNGNNLLSLLDSKYKYYFSPTFNPEEDVMMPNDGLEIFGDGFIYDRRHEDEEYILGYLDGPRFENAVIEELYTTLHMPMFETLGELMEYNPDYIDWLLENTDIELPENERTNINVSHTANIDDTGKQLSLQKPNGSEIQVPYQSNTSNTEIRGTGRTDASSEAQVITIPNADILHIDVYYRFNSSSDILSIYQGNYPNYTTNNIFAEYSTKYVNESGDFGNFSINGNILNNVYHTNFTVHGDTVTITFSSSTSSSAEGYGYYVVVYTETADNISLPELLLSSDDELSSNVHFTNDITYQTSYIGYVYKEVEEVEMRVSGIQNNMVRLCSTNSNRLLEMDNSAIITPQARPTTHLELQTKVVSTQDHLLVPAGSDFDDLLEKSHEIILNSGVFTLDENGDISGFSSPYITHDGSINVKIPTEYNFDNTEWTIEPGTNTLKLVTNVILPGEDEPPVPINNSSRPSVDNPPQNNSNSTTTPVVLEPIDLTNTPVATLDTEEEQVDTGITESEIDWDKELPQNTYIPSKEDIEIVEPDIYTYEELLAMIDRGEAYIDDNNNICDLAGNILGVYRGREQSPRTIDNAKTNDNTVILPYIILTLFCIIGFVYLYKKNKKSE